MKTLGTKNTAEEKHPWSSQAFHCCSQQRHTSPFSYPALSWNPELPPQFIISFSNFQLKFIHDRIIILPALPFDFNSSFLLSFMDFYCIPSDSSFARPRTLSPSPPPETSSNRTRLLAPFHRFSCIFLFFLQSFLIQHNAVSHIMPYRKKTTCTWDSICSQNGSAWAITTLWNRRRWSRKKQINVRL